MIHHRNQLSIISRVICFGRFTAAGVLPLPIGVGLWCRRSGAWGRFGLWGAVLVGFFAALFGGTPTLDLRTHRSMTVVMTTVIRWPPTAANPENGNGHWPSRW